MSRHQGTYPEDWQTIATQIKTDHNWCCLRCGHPHNTPEGFMLGVHHLDLNKSNCAWYNLVPLCQRCHLRIQAKVDMDRVWMFEHSEWFKPYVAGFYASRFQLPTDRGWVTARIEDLIALGQGRITLEQIERESTHGE